MDSMDWVDSTTRSEQGFAPLVHSLPSVVNQLVMTFYSATATACGKQPGPGGDCLPARSQFAGGVAYVK